VALSVHRAGGCGCRERWQGAFVTPLSRSAASIAAFAEPCRMRLLPAFLALCGLIAPPAARAAEAPLELAFSDFFVQPTGPRGLEPTARLLAAQGREVRLVGFMVQREHAQAGRFLLAPRPASMAEHADGEADDLPAATVTVLLPEAQRERVVTHLGGPVALTGRLEYGPAEDETGRVSWLRLRLAPQALAAPTRSH
jgi:hypothetical protein